jgi:hypothetical protein
MKYLSSNPVSSGALMFGAIVAGMLLWAAYKPQAQDFLRMVQCLIFGAP